ncbi:ABC transporter substrate-binding protein [Corynebacterium vitaeruminis]|uniref:Glycine/betaine ABC transporter substrate-binding protein n=1 Tax=Corynebacterium vitaeruminis DSM 20294 TaxID=1224164 RepID=W5Y8I5_9CORY|nr:ABC transporter substrate-binding protein [Corynebacterium vitaeruminis]AHI22808.1 glycine/betaine ABC transporter substrate-binding protein [Corynebacterium vitaeruminis DSM 20294]
MKKTLGILAATGLLATGLAACSSDAASSGSSKIVIGSQDYYSNEIVAEIYAQTLEEKGFSVDRDFRIGQREVYMSDVESGNINLFPEYTGPLLQYWQPDSTMTKSDDVYAALVQAAPGNLQILHQSPATDQDSYVVTREFADKYNVHSLADLKALNIPITIGGNSELESRPNGPKGLKASYDLDVSFTPIEDGGGPLTIKALKDNSVQLALVYTADPSIKSNDLVVLDDPAAMFRASNLVPIASKDLDSGAVDAINTVSEKLTTDDLVSMNSESVNDQKSASDIAAEWLEKNS